jgi:ferredoxin
MERKHCGDCGCIEGELHEIGCDMERCPVCGNQLISCDHISDVFDQNIPRVPWILYPIICARCGKLWPDLFMVPDEEWNHYIPIRERDEVICKECYEFIKTAIDMGAGHNGTQN